MFGAFSHDEVVALAAWIDSLDGGDTANSAQPYWNFTGREQLISRNAVTELRDSAQHYPVLDASPPAKPKQMTPEPVAKLPAVEQLTQHPSGPEIPAASAVCSRMPDLVALWFAHVSLLENTIAATSRTASPLYAGILRVLRAQAGSAIEQPTVAGMDEMKRCSGGSLVDIGLELWLARNGL